MIDKINKQIEELERKLNISPIGHKRVYYEAKLEQTKKLKKIFEEELHDDFIELKSLAQFCERQHINEELGVRDLRHLKSRIDEVFKQKLKNDK